MKKILLAAGDPSGDLRGAELIRALKSRAGAAGLFVSAVGGEKMRGEADEFLADLASRGITGFWEPLRHLGYLGGILSRLREKLGADPPSAVIVIDYYGFNSRILSLARERGIPSYYYIGPQVWASRPWRARALKRLVRKMLVIFPFEERFYAGAGVPARFVGHPLLDSLPDPEAKSAPSHPPLIGLLPGSRPQEISRHLSLFSAAFRLLRTDHGFEGARGLLFAAPHLPDSAYATALAQEGVELVREADYARRRGLDVALCASGTASLENALLGVPMVVAYKLSTLTYLLARALVTVSHIAMPNLIAAKSLVPELIQGAATPEALAREASAILKRPDYSTLRAELAGLRAALGEKGASLRAAEEILG